MMNSCMKEKMVIIPFLNQQNILNKNQYTYPNTDTKICFYYAIYHSTRMMSNNSNNFKN